MTEKNYFPWVWITQQRKDAVTSRDFPTKVLGKVDWIASFLLTIFSMILTKCSTSAQNSARPNPWSVSVLRFLRRFGTIFAAAPYPSPSDLVTGSSNSIHPQSEFLAAIKPPRGRPASDRNDTLLFPSLPNSGDDSMLVLREVIESLHTSKVRKLEFTPGRYDFWPDRCFEKYLFISNNDEGLKRIAFHFEDITELEIDGNGAEFVFHGFIIPFVIENSHGITLKNFSIDYERPFHSEGTILSVVDESLTVHFDEQYPYFIEDSELVFIDERNTRYSWGRLLEFDAVKREPALMAFDYWSKVYVQRGLIPADEIGMFYPSFDVREVGPRQVQLNVPGIKATAGNIMVFGPDHRLVPGIFVQDCEKTLLSGVTVHHSGGMASVFLRCDSVKLESCVVSANEKTGRVVSATADATHFVNCSGQIHLNRCRFECQMDDASNIHGNYATVHRIVNTQTFEFRLRHAQHLGFRLLDIGDRMAFADAVTLHPRGQCVASGVTAINRDLVTVITEEKLPVDLAIGDLVSNFDDSSPEVKITDCTFRGNRARGILLGSAGATLVEGNVFHNPGAAILMEGDGSRWFEQAGVNGMTIRNNRFENCNFGVWGNAVIEVSAPHINEDGMGERCHQDMTISENTFISFDDTPLLLAKGVEKLRFFKNHIERSTAYPPQRIGSESVILHHCEGDTIDLHHARSAT